MKEETQIDLFGTQPKTELTMTNSWSHQEEDTKFRENEDSDGWTAPGVQEVLSKKKTEGTDYIHLGLTTHSDLNGVSYSVSHSSAREMPLGLMGSSWGGGEAFSLEDTGKIKEFFNLYMISKKEQALCPFKQAEPGEDYTHYYRKIPIRNFIFIMGKKLRELLLEKGFDFEAWNKEYMAIEETLPTPEYDAKVARAKELIRLGNNNVEKARLCKSSLKAKLNMSSYGEKPVDSFPSKTLDELKKLVDDMKQETLKLEREARIIYDELKITCYGDIIRGVDDMDRVW